MCLFITFSVPMPVRVFHTRALIRDLFALVYHTDALIVTASSNIGRLALTLRGPQQSSASEDWPWFPSLDPPPWPCIGQGDCPARLDWHGDPNTEQAPPAWWEPGSGWLGDPAEQEEVSE